jgi:hypothetical protein
MDEGVSRVAEANAEVLDFLLRTALFIDPLVLIFKCEEGEALMDDDPSLPDALLTFGVMF